MNKWKYSGHHFKNEARGHIFLGHNKKGAVTISMQGAGSMSQKELNSLGEKIVKAVNALPD